MHTYNIHIYTYTHITMHAYQFSDAAQILAGANLEGSQRPFADTEKAGVYIKCAETYLEVGIEEREGWGAGGEGELDMNIDTHK
jgi:hypothetical protein